MTLKVYYTDNIWNFPRLIAEEENLFQRHNLSVDLIKRDEYKTESNSIYQRSNVQLFKEGEVDFYSACDWGVIKRVSEKRIGEIQIQRPASSNIPYRIYTKSGSEIDDLSHLKSRPVGIKNHSGSHYATIEMLERELSFEEVSVTHIGRPFRRLEALASDEIAAVTLTGPTMVIAEQLGYKPIAEMTAGGAFVGNSHISSGKLADFMNSLNDAIDLINSNPEEYRHHINMILESDLDSKTHLTNTGDISTIVRNLSVPNYPKRMRYPNISEYQQKLRWMRERGLVDQDVQIDEIARTE